MEVAAAGSGSLAMKDRRILAAVSTTAAALSLSGSAFIVLCYILFKELRKFSFKLVFFLAFSDMFCSFFSIVGILIYMLLWLCVWILIMLGHCYLMVYNFSQYVENWTRVGVHACMDSRSFVLIGKCAAPCRCRIAGWCLLWETTLCQHLFWPKLNPLGRDPSNGLFCYAQHYSAHFFCVASFLWTTTIAFTLHRTVVKHKTDVEDFGSIFHLYVWGASLAMTIIRSIGSDYGQLGAWCWNGSEQKGKVAYLVTFYTPLWGAILYNGFTYYQVNRMLGNATRMAVGMSDRSYQLDAGAGMKAGNKWGYYPLILIGSWAFATVNRIFDFLNPSHKIFWLSLADVWFAGLMGLFNSIAYGLNSSLRRAVSERFDMYVPETFKRWFPQRLKGQQQEQELASLIVEGL